MKIKWTKRANNSYKKILAYTIDSFGHTVANSSVQRTLNVLDIIVNNPHAYKVHDGHKHCRQAVLVKSISLYYTIKEDQVVIIAIWQSSLNPGSLNLDRGHSSL